MSINRKFATLGLIIILVPFLGIPDTWKYALFILLGLLVIFTATEFHLPKKKMTRRKTDVVKNSETFTENGYVERKLEPRSEELGQEIPETEDAKNF